MRPLLRRNRDAVSAVIETIMLAAITVVLEEVLYIMVSGLISPSGSGPQIMGVAVSKTTDGTNWTLQIVSTPLGLTPAMVHLQLVAPNGTSIVYKTFSALNWVADGASYTGTGTSIRAGDRLFVDVVRFPLDYQVVISSSTVLYTGVLR